MQKASGCFHSLLRIIAYILAGLLVLSLPLSILANNTLRIILSADEISEVVANILLLNQDLRMQLMDNFLSNLRLDPDSNLRSGTLANLHPNDQAEVAKMIFPEEWLRTQIRMNVGNIIAWVESEEPYPILVLYLESLHTELRQGGSFRIAEKWVDSLPACTQEQEIEMVEAWQRGEPMGSALCSPSGEIHQQMIDRANQQLLMMLDDVPLEISLLEGMDSDEFTNSLDEFHRGILGLLLVMRWARIMPFLFLGLIMTITIRSWLELRNWWGIPVGFGALITFVVVLTANLIGLRTLKNALSSSAQPAELQESLIDTLWGVASSILNRSAFHALVFIIVVFLAFTIPVLLRRKGREGTVQSPAIDLPRSRETELPPPPQIEPFQPETMKDAPANDRSDGDPE